MFGPVFTITFAEPHYVYYAWAIVGFMVVAPFTPFMFGWRLGDKVPVTGKRITCLTAVMLAMLAGTLIIGSGNHLNTSFAAVVLPALYLPVITAVIFAGALNSGILLLLVAFAATIAYAYVLLKYDRYIVRKDKKNGEQEK